MRNIFHNRKWYSAPNNNVKNTSALNFQVVKDILSQSPVSIKEKSIVTILAKSFQRGRFFPRNVNFCRKSTFALVASRFECNGGQITSIIVEKSTSNNKQMTKQHSGVKNCTFIVTWHLLKIKYSVPPGVKRIINSARWWTRQLFRRVVPRRGMQRREVTIKTKRPSSATEFQIIHSHLAPFIPE